MDFSKSFLNTSAVADMNAVNESRELTNAILMAESRETLDLAASELLPTRIGSKRTVSSMVGDQKWHQDNLHHQSTRVLDFNRQQLSRCQAAFDAAVDALNTIENHRSKVKLISSKSAEDQTKDDKEYVAKLAGRNLDAEAIKANQVAKKANDELKSANDNVSSLVREWQIQQNHKAKRAKEYKENQCLMGLETLCTERPITDICRDLHQTLKIPNRFANLTFAGAMRILEEMKRSFRAQKEGKIPNMAVTGFEAHNLASIQTIIDGLKTQGGEDGCFLSRQNLALALAKVCLNDRDAQDVRLMIEQNSGTNAPKAFKELMSSFCQNRHKLGSPSGKKDAKEHKKKSKDGKKGKDGKRRSKDGKGKGKKNKKGQSQQQQQSAPAAPAPAASPQTQNTAKNNSN